MQTTPELLVCLGEGIFSARDASCPSTLGTELTDITDVAILGDEIIVLRRASPQLVTFDLSGKHRRSCVIPNVVLGHGLRALPNDRLALTDMDGHKVLILNQAFEITQTLSPDGMPAHQRPFNHPTDCAQSADGTYFVADGYGNSCIHLFNEAGQHLRSFGEPGNGPGQFSTPHSIVVDASQHLWVADRENNRVQRFDPQGRYLDEIAGLYKPMALDLRPDGCLLVTDQTPRLSLYSPDRELIGRCRTFGTFGHGVACSQTDGIAVAEMLPSKLRLLEPNVSS